MQQQTFQIQQGANTAPGNVYIGQTPKDVYFPSPVTSPEEMTLFNADEYLQNLQEVYTTVEVSPELLESERIIVEKEYDDKGQVIKETRTVYRLPAPAPPVRRQAPRFDGTPWPDVPGTPPHVPGPNTWQGLWPTTYPTRGPNPYQLNQITC